MQRLTEWTGYEWIPVQERVDGKIIGNKTCLQRLAEYENTGLTPEEIMDGKMITRWIPVEEWLPEDGTYLCTFDGELCGLDEPFAGMCGIENGRWDEDDCVIAWMSLPEPYQPPVLAEAGAPAGDYADNPTLAPGA